MSKKLAYKLFALIALIAVPGIGYSLFRIGPITMTIVDSSSGAPIANAVVVYHLETTEGTFTGHGGRKAQLAIVEVLSDPTGVFEIPSRMIFPFPFLLGTNYKNPAIYIVVPGYEPAFISNRQKIIPTLREALHWERNGAIVKLRKADGSQKYTNAFENFSNEFRSLYGWPNIDICGWKKFPRAVVAFEQEFMVTDPRISRNVSTPLQDLLRDEAVRGSKSLYVQRCGSPNKFFSAYPPLCPDRSSPMTNVTRRYRVDELSHSGTRMTLYTLGYCPTDQRIWLYEQGKGWSVRSDYSLDDLKDKRRQDIRQ